MGAEKKFSEKQVLVSECSERGQSIVEFLLALPVFFILTAMLIKINTTIQVSLVNQKYARTQAHFLAYNSPYFPSLRLQQGNMMAIGVSENSALESEKIRPDPTIVNIARRGVTGSEERATPSERSKVRVRTSVAMCSQQTVFADGSNILPVQPVDGERRLWAASGPYQLSDRSVFEPCRSNFQ